MEKSRFEKFQKYRDQIHNQNELTKIFVTENDSVTEYKNMLNLLSKNILSDNQPIHLDFLTLISVDRSHRKEVNELKKFIDSFDLVLLNKIRDTANHIICQSSNDLHKEFENNWLVNDRGWLRLTEINHFFNECSKKYADSRAKLPESINSLKQLINHTSNPKNANLFTQSKINFNPISLKIKKRKFYFLSLIITIFFGLVLLLISILYLTIN